MLTPQQRLDRFQGVKPENIWPATYRELRMGMAAALGQVSLDEFYAAQVHDAEREPAPATAPQSFSGTKQRILLDENVPRRP